MSNKDDIGEISSILLAYMDDHDKLIKCVEAVIEAADSGDLDESHINELRKWVKTP